MGVLNLLLRANSLIKKSIFNENSKYREERKRERKKEEEIHYVGTLLSYGDSTTLSRNNIYLIFRS